MATNEFDERYPALFQPGGEEPGTEPAMAAPAPTGQVHTAQQEGVTPPVGAAGHTANAAAEPAPGEAARPALKWLAPLATAVLMIAAGVFALTAQYWIEASMVPGPGDSNRGMSSTWGYDIAAAGSGLTTVGLGIVAVCLFLASRLQAATEALGRTAFGAFTVAVGIAGLVCLFAFALFPEQADYTAAAYDGATRRTPWPIVVMPTGLWLVCLSALMLAVLIVVPKVWVEGPGGDDASEDSLEQGRPSLKRATWFGGGAVAAGLLALLAPHLFSAADRGAQQFDRLPSLSGPQFAQLPAPALLVAGLLILGWAAIRSAMVTRADKAPSGVEH